MEAVEELNAPVPGVIDTLWAEGEGGGEGGEGAELQEQQPAGGEGLEEVDPAAGETDGADDKTGAEGKEGSETGEPKQDGRKNPDAIRKHLAGLKGNPETAALGKELTDRLGKTRGYEEVFPTVKEAREVKALVQSVGGAKQITEAIQSHVNMQRVDSMLESGNEAIVDEIFDQAGDGMVKLGPAILDRIAKQNPEAFATMMQPHALGVMNNAGLPGAINAMVDALEANDTNMLKGILARMVQWYTGLQKGAQPKQADPERTKFEEERAKFQKEQEDTKIQQVFNTNSEHAGKAIDKEIAADVKRLGLGKAAIEKVRNEIFSEIIAMRKADQTFVTGLQARFNGRVPKPEALEHLNSFVDSSVKAAADKVIGMFYGPRGTAPKPGTQVKDPTAPKKAASQQGAGRPADAGWTRVTAIPKAQDINYDDPLTDTMSGKAVLKNGTKVQWR